MHLADLHIGKKLGSFSLISDQRHVLAQVVEIAKEEKPQAVILAGDIYDKTVPSQEAVEIYEEFLLGLLALDLQIFVIYGNHDSGTRLSFLQDLTSRFGLHVSPVYEGAVKAITLTDDFGEVDFYLLPFLSPTGQRYTGTYEELVASAIGEMEISSARRNVLVTHQFVQNKEGKAVEESDSEDSLYIGGTQGISYQLFQDFHYVALGHLHRPQFVGRKEIRYAGSLLPYSIKEGEKSLTVIEMDGKGEVLIHERTLSPLRQVKVVTGTLEDILTQGDDENYIVAILLDTRFLREDLVQLQKVFPYLLSYRYAQEQTVLPLSEGKDLQGLSPLDVFKEFYQQQIGEGALSQEQEAYLIKMIQEIWE